MRLVLDDFRTGYSSLGYLKAARARALKIKRSFIDASAAHPLTRSDAGALLAGTTLLAL